MAEQKSSANNPVLSALPTAAANSTGKSANDTLIAHVDRLWNSAVQNAARVGLRIQIVGGGIVVMLGLTFSSMTWLTNPPPAMAFHAYFLALVRLLVALAVLAFGAALAHLYIRGEPTRMAADIMELDKSDAGKAPTKTLVFRKTYNAYYKLKEMNRLEKDRLKKAQGWLAWGLVCSVLAVILYLAGWVCLDLFPKGIS